MFPQLGHGIGLRPPYYGDAERGDADVDWFEVISENFFGAGGNPRRVLRKVAERYPVALHGVSMSIGSVDAPDERLLNSLTELIAEIQPAMVSDHLCWSSFGGHTVHDLWPMPYTEESLDHVVKRVRQVQDRLRRRILLENPSSYVAFSANCLGEAEFLAEVSRRADCGILLDVNNVYVSSRNHGLDPDAYFAAMPRDRIGYLHLAGHTDHGDYLLDTHDQPVAEPVWALYRAAIARFGARSTLIEWDDNLPTLDTVVGQSIRANEEASRA